MNYKRHDALWMLNNEMIQERFKKRKMEEAREQEPEEKRKR